MQEVYFGKLTSSLRLLTSKTVLPKCWPGNLSPATPKAAAVVAAEDKAKPPKGRPKKKKNKIIIK